ncbi:unnamed protein product [Trichogramma brassicae]|uniref:Uncharacterized protein n=1 Tax=Trichogramma brassicae TaxID=86971 RepID=A0A6H5IW44_9HYME|nr:unnamed protein product [Trichogramma brassicae]
MVVGSALLLAKDARWTVLTILYPMACLSAAEAVRRAIRPHTAGRDVAGAPAAVAAQSILATTDAAVYPANPYVAEFQRLGGQVIRQRCDSRLRSRVRPPQRLDYLFVEMWSTQRFAKLFGDRLLGGTLVEVPDLDHGCVLYGAGSGLVTENPAHLRAKIGGVVYAFLKLQHKGTSSTASDALDAASD